MDREVAQRQHSTLSNQIKMHNKLYYENHESIISDFEYDELFRELIEIENQYPELATPDSPSQQVGAPISEKFTKITRNKPMLSIDNAKDEGQVKDFEKKIKSKLGPVDTDIEYICEMKLDGVAIELTYRNGTLVLASTRGDGVTGEIITENAKTSKSIPKNLNAPYPDFLEVRGEVFINLEDFRSLIEKQKKEGTSLIKTPRNTAAGSLKQLDPTETAKRPLSFFCYGIGEANGISPNSQDEILKTLQRLGLPVNQDGTRVVKTIDEAILYYKNLLERRNSLPFEIDGMVIKVNNLGLQEALGKTARAPVWATAYKFPPKAEETTLTAIEFQTGRTGAITPVAILEPVEINYVTISRASLHNFDHIRRLDVRIGDRVVVERAGDVIPQVAAVVIEKRGSDSRTLSLPTHCATCKSILHHVEGDASWRCTGGLTCPSQTLEALKLFVSKPGFDIDGLGEANLKAFINEGLLKKPSEIFTMESKLKRRETLFDQAAENFIPLEERDGWGDKSAKNLFLSINKSKNVKLSAFIYALGIPQIGKTNAKIVANQYGTIENLLGCLEKASNDKKSTEYLNLRKIAGIGEKASEDILSFYRNNLKEIINLKETVNIQDENSRNVNLPLSNKNIVFTGKLGTIKRSDAEKQASALGANTSSFISKTTSILVVGLDPGSKLSKAKNLGIKILTEQEWLEFINNLRD